MVARGAWPLIVLAVIGGFGNASVAHPTTDRFGAAIDLREPAVPEGSGYLSDVLRPVGLVRGDDGTARRFYVAPLIGASWGSLAVDDATIIDGYPLLTAGGAVGVAVTRHGGQLRIEGEVRYRDGVQRAGTAGPSFSLAIGAEDNWSSMVNLWRDVAITRSVGVYGGGGIGAGGYRFDLDQQLGLGRIVSNQQVTAFAWQVGGGAIYAVGDRITLDLGYRFFSTLDADATVIASGPGFPPIPLGNLPSRVCASELLFTLRIYEPFRGWR